MMRIYKTSFSPKNDPTHRFFLNTIYRNLVFYKWTVGISASLCSIMYRYYTKDDALYYIYIYFLLVEKIYVYNESQGYKLTNKSILINFTKI